MPRVLGALLALGADPDGPAGEGRFRLTRGDGAAGAARPTLKARLTATGWCEAVLERERADGVGERDLRPLRECARRLARASAVDRVGPR